MSTPAIDLGTDFQTSAPRQNEAGFVSQARNRDGNPRAERNRANAAHSTGPRTDEGKATSCRNALKHGLSIQRHIVLQHEGPAEYDQLRAELRDIFAPQSPREQLAVEDIAQCRWALRRFDEAELSLIDYHFGNEANPAQDPMNHIPYGRALGYSAIPPEPGDDPVPEYPSFLLLQRYRGHWDRRYQRALAEFDRAQRARRAEAAEERKQADALYKQEAERRKQELHAMKMQILAEKLEQQKQKTAKAAHRKEEADLNEVIRQYLNAPPPDLTEEEPAASGFVPSERTQSYEPTMSTGSSPAM